MEYREITAAIQNSIEDHRPLDGPVGRYISRERYVQHNVNVEDGRDAIVALHDLLPRDTTRSKVLRAIQDGEFSAAHVDYDLWGPKAGFDIHRWEDGMIVEHWDNLQEVPSHPNPSGRTMFDGTAEIGDPTHTSASKALVEEFASRVMVGREVGAAARFFAGDRLLQHNPFLADGAGFFLDHVGASGGEGTVRYDEIHMLIGEGDLVLAVSEGRADDAPMAFYDLFRVEDGVIAEHWDVVEAIPPRESWKNDNGKF